MSMDTTAQIVWHAFLQSSPPDRQAAFLRCISPELAVEFKKIAPISLDPRNGIEPIEEELSQVHFSWMAPFLRSLPENEIKLFLSCLTPEQIKGLKQSLLLTNALPSPSALGKTYLKKALFDLIAAPDLIPIPCLPADPLNALLELSYTEFSSLIDLLSMHDLSIEIRQIIETTKLKEIYGLLSKAQTTFLKTLLHKKEAVSFKKMGLLNWKGDRSALRAMLLQRGINRIAKALHGHNPSLLWHLSHRLDFEKGQLLINLCTPLDHPRASALLSEQVVELINALKQNNPPQNI
jgi:hypothetical protein